MTDLSAFHALSADLVDALRFSADSEGDFEEVLVKILDANERRVREQIAALFEGDAAMTNDELTDLRALVDTDPEHEQCAQVWSRYAARVARGGDPR